MLEIVEEGNDNIRKRHSNAELLEFLKKYHTKTGKIPTQRDFDKNSIYPNHVTYFRRFGSWEKALELAGLDLNDEKMLEYLEQFYTDNGKVPVNRDFDKHSIYPSRASYIKHFGSWQKALKFIGLDTDTMARKGILKTNQQKGRLFEIYVKEHFTKKSVDISGQNCGSPFDGICPDDKIYDAKSSKLIINRWSYCLNNEYRLIDYFYLGAFDKDFKKLLHVWRIPSNFIKGKYLNIGLERNYSYNVETMKDYEISHKFNIE